MCCRAESGYSRRLSNLRLQLAEAAASAGRDDSAAATAPQLKRKSLDLSRFVLAAP